MGLELGVTCAALLVETHPNPSSVVAARRDVTRALGAISELGPGAPTGGGGGKIGRKQEARAVVRLRWTFR